MKKGDRLVYGSSDKKNAIPCIFTGEFKITSSGEILITAAVLPEGSGKIIADVTLFDPVNSMCQDCMNFGSDCNGTINPVYTGCIFKNV